MQARTSYLLGVCVALGVAMAISSGAKAAGPMFPGLVLVDEINCGNASDPHTVMQYPSGCSSIQTILGRQCRTITPQNTRACYFAYRIGAGKITPGKAYILTVDYPEDQPRSIFVTNAGAMTTEGFRTGNTLGNAFDAPYVMQDRESLSLPLSGQWETWQQFFHLHERFAGVKEPRGAATLPDSPTTGFLVTVFQFKKTDDPTSKGAAVSHIRLYEAPDEATYTQQLNLPPAGLPQRHLFWREEMADIPAVDGSSASTRVVTDRVDWYRYKARLLKFLGMNTFTKDLLEFGSNQNWDSTPYGGNNWVYMGSTPWMWDSIVDVMGSYGLNVLPYYEYSGSKGDSGLGWERHARPLTDTNAALDYTHISWTETANADITWPATLPDLEKMLDCTIVFQKDKANFIGAWLRPRSSQMPISFSNDALARFAVEANGGVAVTRAALIPKGALYVNYLNWWYGVRRQFLTDLRDYLREQVDDDAVIIYTWDPAEGGAVYPDWNRPNVITDSVSTWTALGKTAKSLSSAIAEHYQYMAQTLPPLTWEITSGSGKMWEWDHAVPRPDVANYHDREGVMMSHTVNTAYSTSDAYSFEQFRTAGGLAMVRHYMLNENAPDRDENGIVGYFVANTNLAGPYTMLGEACAMAYGDPRYIGYLSGDSYNRGFPQYVRNFNAAFLALPALPSAVVPNAANNANVIVRSIDAGEHGTYLAIVNVGFTAADNVTVTLPTTGTVTDAATGQAITATGGTITVSLYPCQLQAVRIAPAAVEGLLGDFNGDGTVTHGDYTVWADNFGKLIATVQAEHPGWFPAGSYPASATTLTQGLYTTWADHFGDTAPLTVGQPSMPAVVPVSADSDEAVAPTSTRSARAAARQQARLERAAARQQRRAERAAR